jgi:hypothetical protein
MISDQSQCFLLRDPIILYLFFEFKRIFYKFYLIAHDFRNQ